MEHIGKQKVTQVVHKLGTVGDQDGSHNGKPRYIVPIPWDGPWGKALATLRVVPQAEREIRFQWRKEPQKDGRYPDGYCLLEASRKPRRGGVPGEVVVL